MIKQEKLNYKLTRSSSNGNLEEVKYLLEQVNPRKMKNFIPDINKYKNNLK